MNTMIDKQQFEYLIENLDYATDSLVGVDEGHDACVYINNVRDMLLYLKAKIDAQYYGDFVPDNLK